jgi:DNA-directed RNA polymerase subunit RPC12/RpoP
VSYRCPTCTTRYRSPPNEHGAPGYVRCKVCGFLIDVAANSVADGSDLLAPARSEQVRRWPLVIGVLLVLIGTAWLTAVVLKSGF